MGVPISAEFHIPTFENTWSIGSIEELVWFPRNSQRVRRIRFIPYSQGCLWSYNARSVATTHSSARSSFAAVILRSGAVTRILAHEGKQSRASLSAAMLTVATGAVIKQYWKAGAIHALKFIVVSRMGAEVASG
jgi:hypothetical protein